MSSNFNSRPLILFAGGAIYIIFTLMVFRALMGGELLKSFGLIGLAGVGIFSVIRKSWLGIMLGSLGIYSQGGTALPFLSTVPAQIAVAAIITGYGVLDYAMKKQPPMLRWRTAYTLFLLAAIMVTARVIYDKPGGANIGSGVGGLKSALQYLAGFYAFFIAYWAATQAGHWKTTVRWILLMSIVGWGVNELFRYIGPVRKQGEFS